MGYIQFYVDGSVNKHPKDVVILYDSQSGITTLQRTKPDPLEQLSKDMNYSANPEIKRRRRDQKPIFSLRHF